MYQIFDICIDSDLPRAGLKTLSGGEVDWQVLLATDEFDQSQYEWVHEWMAEGEGSAGKALMASAKSGDKYLLRFTDIADFEIDFTKRQIQSVPLCGQPASTLTHLLHDQVIPRILSHQGRPVVHASAVILPDGSAVAFLGPSGWGKSTLASAFYREGYPVLTDDCILFDAASEGDCLNGIAAYPSLRLWQDSVDYLFPGRDDFSQVSNFSEKLQRFIQVQTEGNVVISAPISALFLLRDPSGPQKAERIQIKNADGKTAMMALMASLFALDLSDLGFTKRNFQWAGEVLRANTHFYTLDFPHQFHKLPDVVECVLKQMKSYF